MSADNNLKVLLNVKTHREERISREVKKSNEDFRKADDESRRAHDHVRRSKESLAARQDAVWDKIIGKRIKLDEIEDTKAEVGKIDNAHNKLQDAAMQADHIRAEREKIRDTTTAEHVTAVKNVKKYQILLEQARQQRQAAIESAEELEIEELAGIRRGIKI